MPAANSSQPSEPLHEGPGAFRSLLFGDAEADASLAARPEPEFFGDLNLDQLAAEIVARKQPYELTPFFYAPLHDLETIRYRQAVFAELERPEIGTLMNDFARQEIVAHYSSQQRAMARSETDFGRHHRARAFLNAALAYCETVERLAAGLDAAELHARGLLGLRDYLRGYVAGAEFGTLSEEARTLDQQLDQVRYSFLIKGSKITVGPYDDSQPDYSAQVTATFERFQQGAVRSYLPESRGWDTYSSIGVLYLVSKLYPELFARLIDFCRRHADYLDHTLAVFDRELEFYLGYLEHIAPLRDVGLRFSYPEMSIDDKSERVLETFDLVLAGQRVGAGAAVVCNDVCLGGPERILVITGPNNGGKTTLARAVGQVHYLAALGCPVPGCDARLFLCDRIFTRFERREDIETLAGKLQDELNRLHDALAAATPSSLFVLNEMFNSTTVQDALLLSREILERVSELDALCVCVTFVDELASLSERTVSMVTSVDPYDPAIRTYKVLRRPADGRAYARALADKYGLTYARLTARSRP